MAKKITIVGKKAERIEQTGRFQRRIEPAEFAAALGAELCEEIAPGARDPITLLGIGHQLLERSPLRGGKSASKEVGGSVQRNGHAGEVTGVASINGGLKACMAKLSETVEVTKKKRSGVPVLKGTRITIAQIMAEIADGRSVGQLCKSFELNRRQVEEVLHGIALCLDQPMVE